MVLSDLLAKGGSIIQSGLLVTGGVCLLATIIARLTPTTKDDDAVKSVKSVLDKVLHFLPTIGINPQTQKLMDALEEQQAALPVEQKPAA